MLNRGPHLGGKESLEGPSEEIVNPANGAVIARVVNGSVEDVNRAVTLAHVAYTQGAWASMNSRDRGRLLHKLADLIASRAPQLGALESANVGKPLAGAIGEMGAVANCFEYYAGAVNKFCGETIPVAADGHALTFREPLGVCGLIVPWNFPLVVTAWKVAPALAMGNTVVIKPAEATPLTALALADLALEAGFPPGVLNVVPGPGPITGAALVAHPLVRKVSFTGSTQTGRAIMALAAQDMTRVSLELGGKSANLVFDDTDLDVCIPSSLWSVFDNAGQDCCARSRMLVQRGIFERFVEAFVAATEKIVVGDPQAASTEMGPLIGWQHRDKVCAMSQRGEEAGARRLCGGLIPQGDLAAGAYLTPSVYVDVSPHMDLARQEIFGPVVCIMPFEHEGDAVALANDSQYGLAGSLWTRDIARALRVSRALEVGMLSINSSSSVHIEAPFGGTKQSGIGREQGMVALDHFSQYKSVFIANH